MKVISGKYKGKILKGFDIEGTRPTMDRVKESLFGTIQNYLTNSICLDLFAGSGSLGIEALSNGAKSCYFVDNSKEILKVLKSNLDKVDSAYIIEDNYDKFLKTTDKRFDIIFLDPPYAKNLIKPSIKRILELNLLNDEGIIVCEYELEKFDCDLKIIKEKRYGSKNIRIYKKG